MPVDTIYDQYRIQFGDTLHVLAQQQKSRLRPYVMERMMQGEAMSYDGLGTVEARELTGRLNKTQFADIEHLRRKIPRRQFEVTLPIDQFDVEGRMSNPQQDYAQAVMMAMDRMYDRVCIEAMFADVQTGKDFSTTITATSDGVLTVNATGGLTLAKLLEIQQNFVDNEIGNDIPIDIVYGITGDEQTTLLQISQLTSGDFTRQYALERGALTYAVGIGLVKFGAGVSNPMLAVSGGVRTSFALSTGGLCVGLSRDFGIKVSDRNDYINVTQVQVTGVIGAVRTEGKRIQKVTTTDI